MSETEDQRAFILETERLILRHQRPSDLDDLFTLYQDPEIIRYIPDHPRDFDETRQELEWHMNGHPRFPELGLWATIYKPTNAFIGRCGLLPWTIDGRDEVEVAYTIDRTHWGLGLATEAATAITHHAFNTLRLPRLIALIDPENHASARVATKIGMSFEKEFTDEYGTAWVFSMRSPLSGTNDGPAGDSTP